jgi:hypothetical protein
MSNSKDVTHIAKFDGQNYSLWKLGLWVLLEQHDLIKLVTGDEAIPATVKHFSHYSNITKGKPIEQKQHIDSLLI